MSDTEVLAGPASSVASLLALPASRLLLDGLSSVCCVLISEWVRAHPCDSILI